MNEFDHFENKIQENINKQKQFKYFSDFFNYIYKSIYQPNLDQYDDDFKNALKRYNIPYTFVESFSPPISSGDELISKSRAYPELLQRQQLKHDNLYEITNYLKNGVNFENFKNQNLEQILRHTLNYIDTNELKNPKDFIKELKFIANSKDIDKELDYYHVFDSSNNIDNLENIYQGVLLYLSSLPKGQLDKLYQQHNLTDNEIKKMNAQFKYLDLNNKNIYDKDKSLQIGKYFINSLDNNIKNKEFLKHIASGDLGQFFTSPLEHYNQDGSIKKNMQVALEDMVENLNKSRIKDDVSSQVQDAKSMQVENNSKKSTKSHKETKDKNEELEEIKDIYSSPNETIVDIYKNVQSDLSTYIANNYDHKDILLIMASQDGINENTKSTLSSMLLKDSLDPKEQEIYEKEILPAFVSNVLISDNPSETAHNIKSIYDYKIDKFGNMINPVDIKHNNSVLSLNRNNKLFEDYNFYLNKNDGNETKAWSEFMSARNNALNSNEILRSQTTNNLSKLYSKIDEDKKGNEALFKQYNSQLQDAQYKLGNNKWGVLTNLMRSRYLLIPSLLFAAPFTIGLLGMSYLLPYIRSKIIQKKYKNLYDKLQGQKDAKEKQTDIFNQSKYVINLDKEHGNKISPSKGNTMIDLNEIAKAKDYIYKKKAQTSFNKKDKTNAIFIKAFKDEDQNIKDIKQGIFLKSQCGSSRIDNELGKIVDNFNSENNLKVEVVKTSEFYNDLYKDNSKDIIAIPNKVFKDGLSAKNFYQSYLENGMIDKNMLNKENFVAHYSDKFKHSNLSGDIDKDFELLANQFSSKLKDNNYKRNDLEYLKMYKKDLGLMKSKRLDPVSFLTLHPNLINQLDLNEKDKYYTQYQTIQDFITSANGNIFGVVTNKENTNRIEDKYIPRASNVIFEQYCASKGVSYQDIMKLLSNPRNTLNQSINLETKRINSLILKEKGENKYEKTNTEEKRKDHFKSSQNQREIDQREL